MYSFIVECHSSNAANVSSSCSVSCDARRMHLLPQPVLRDRSSKTVITTIYTLRSSARVTPHKQSSNGRWKEHSDSLNKRSHENGKGLGSSHLQQPGQNVLTTRGRFLHFLSEARRRPVVEIDGTIDGKSSNQPRGGRTFCPSYSNFLSVTLTGSKRRSLLAKTSFCFFSLTRAPRTGGSVELSSHKTDERNGSLRLRYPWKRFVKIATTCVLLASR